MLQQSDMHKLYNVAEFMHLPSLEELTCPFCRQPVHKDEEEANMISMRRVEANDPIAMCEEGKHCYREGDYEGAFKYWTKAAELGDADAHCQLASFLYGRWTVLRLRRTRKRNGITWKKLPLPVILRLDIILHSFSWKMVGMIEQ